MELALPLRIWGVRGSIATPLPTHMTYGGNTSCIQIDVPGDDVFIFDAGTGIRQCAKQYPPAIAAAKHFHIFLTHFHWDHLAGLTSFAPLYSPCRITFYTCSLQRPESLLRCQFQAPFYPVQWDDLAARCDFVQLDSQSFSGNGLTVHPFPVFHPQGATGFRIEWDGKSIVYVPDREPGQPALDRTLRDFAASADLLLLDAQYTPEEYEIYRGWGHSSWLESVDVARDASVRRLLLFHHDPDHDDATLQSIESQARRHFEAVAAARECEGWDGFMNSL